MSRRAYLDWLRGVAVLIMVEAHTIDSWTRLDDRSRSAYGWALVVGGLGAPVFLFLAGLALVLAIGSRISRGLGEADAVARARRRGWQIVGLAFLFRAQAIVVSGGSLQSMLKVDILNVMGVSMLAASVLWVIGRNARARSILFASTTAAVAVATPLVRTTGLLGPLPDPVEWYIRPFPGRTTFALFPWMGFLLAGCAIGLWLDGARTPAEERRVVTRLAVLGPAMATAAYAASFLPPIDPALSVWASSPTFFVLRLGVVIASLPLAYAWNSRRRGWSPLQELGLASLFVYWIHVELVYGSPSVAIHRRLTFAQALSAYAAFSVFLFGLVRLKNRALGPLSGALRERYSRG